MVKPISQNRASADRLQRAVVIALFGAMTMTANGIDTKSRLAGCPSTPNCVSSDARGKTHGIEPLAVIGDPVAAWKALREILDATPRVRIVEATSDYIHAESRTLIFRFTDDVEFELRASASIIAVRSASRVGRSDLGVNRRRIESIREQLRKRGVVR